MIPGAAPVRVLLHHVAPSGGADITRAYHRVSAALHSVPGMAGNELLGSVLHPDRFVVVSRWADLDAFRAWECGPDHRQDTAALRPFRDTTLRRPFDVLRVVAAY